jgi:hypothetical protein
MKKIALISDNHSYIGDDILKAIEGSDEVWHAGDIGELDSIKPIINKYNFKAVYGNIDDQEIRGLYPLNEIFECEGVKVLMTHIGGYPSKYAARVKKLITEHKPNLYICGHSHICKVMPDRDNNLLHMNPGAYGHHGFHSIRTILKFEINDGKIANLNAIEIGRRGVLQ